MDELKVITDKKLKDVLDQAQLKKEIEYEDAYYSDIVNTTNYTMNEVESYFAYEEDYLSNNIYGTIYKVVFNGNVESPGRWSDSKKGDKLTETRYIRVSVTGLVANKDGKINEDLLEIETTLNSEHREQSRATKDFMDSLVRDAKVVKVK